MRGKRGIRVFMLSPQGKMSPFQTAQMYSLQDANIFNIAIRAACSTTARTSSRRCPTTPRSRRNTSIGAVNSINWARVAAQVVYYFQGLFRGDPNQRRAGRSAVPSGNFGNICAGHIARMMGLPIARLILATNENDVLDEFFRTGVYRPRHGENRCTPAARRWIFPRPPISSGSMPCMPIAWRRFATSGQRHGLMIDTHTADGGQGGA